MVLLNIDDRRKLPLFKQVYEQMKDLIDKDILKPGDRLPSTRSLAENLGVHRSTVYKAYEELWAFGYLESRPGSYTVVRKKPTLATFAEKSDRSLLDWETASSKPARTLYQFYQSIESGNDRSPTRKIIDMASLDLDARLFPVDDFRKSMNRIIIEKGPDLLKYGPHEGYRPLREFIAHRLQNHGISTSWEEILITNGAQNGFDLILKLMAEAGSRVIVESPTYSLAIPLLYFYQADIVGVPMATYGIDLECLERELKKKRPAFVYTIPNFQNPTGITTCQSHREELLSLCERFKVPLVEDAFEEEMKYFGKVPLPIKSMDRSQIVVYLGTFSKVLFPGIRIGWIAANRECIRRLSALKRFSDLSTSTPVQAALSDFCWKGSYDIHVKRMHRIYRKRMQCAVESLKTHVTHENVTWTDPTGGYLIWLTLVNVDQADHILEEIFLANDVRILTGRVFFPEETARKYIRLSISTLNEEEIAEGMRRLGRSIEQIYGE